ncbi:MAG: GMC family oxidoreductase [Sphingomonas sp.]|nr:GMC family oxidoreductase [Sphingomonas sp.]
MLKDGRQLAPPDRPTRSDVVICGGGTVGLLLARTLADAGKHVIVVEAGGPVSTMDFNADMGVAGGRDHLGYLAGRGAGLGGTSAYWGGQLAEFNREDFAAWPIDLDEVAPWYAKAYDLLGVPRPKALAEMQQLIGSEVADPNASVERFFTLWLDQPNLATMLSTYVRKHQRMEIVLNSRVTGWEFEGSRMTGVTVAVGDASWTIAADAVVLACGTIENTRIMLNTAQRAATPWHGNPRIGRAFQDHLGGKIARVEVLDERKLRDTFENGRIAGSRFQPKLRFSHAHGRPDGLGMAGMLSYESNVSENLSNLKRTARAIMHGTQFSGLATLPRDVLAVGRAFVPLTMRYLRDRRVMAMWDRSIDYSVQAEQRPIADSRIMLTDGPTDRYGWAKASICWKVDGVEVCAIRNFAIASDTYLQQRGIARLVPAPALLDGDPAFLDTLVDTYHQAGGLCMSARAEDGVVDQNCRVWEVDNLYVVGAAVFPSSSHANVTFTALALAVRLGEHLSREVR